MKKYGLSALFAAGLLAGGLTATSASAADLGGNCCADLEERIAELEATTARKGNRKVSLTVSGWVAEQVMYWDDGTESNTYVSGIGATLASNVKFTGQATISPGWSAGYVLHLEATTQEAFGLNQLNDDARAALGSDVHPLQSYWFVKSEQLGKLSIGRQSHASDNTAILVDGSGSLVTANWVLFDGAGFFLRTNATGALSAFTFGAAAFCGHTSLGIGGDCNGVPLDSVRYDSPTFAGFSVSASWGEDDFWDIAGRYAGEFGGFKLAVAAAYSENKDENVANVGAVGLAQRDSEYFQVGAYLQHVPSGLWIYGAYGQEDNNNITLAGNLNDSDGDHWYIKGGIRQRWTALGHTVLYGEYGDYNDQHSDAAVDLAGGTLGLDSNLEMWGLGIVQEVDAAAMSVWVKYRNLDASITGTGAATDASGDIDMVIFGGLINF